VLISPAKAERGAWICELSLFQDGVAELLATRSAAVELKRLRPSGAGDPGAG